MIFFSAVSVKSAGHIFPAFANTEDPVRKENSIHLKSAFYLYLLGISFALHSLPVCI